MRALIIRFVCKWWETAAALQPQSHSYSQRNDEQGSRFSVSHRKTWISPLKEKNPDFPFWETTCFPIQAGRVPPRNCVHPAPPPPNLFSELTTGCRLQLSQSQHLAAMGEGPGLGCSGGADTGGCWCCFAHPPHCSPALTTPIIFTRWCRTCEPTQPPCHLLCLLKRCCCRARQERPAETPRRHSRCWKCCYRTPSHCPPHCTVPCGLLPTPQPPQQCLPAAGGCMHWGQGWDRRLWLLVHHGVSVQPS